MGWLQLAFVTTIATLAGFVVGFTLRRGDIVGVLVFLSIPATAIAVPPVYSQFDDPAVGDDWGGISAVILMLWLVLWFDIGMVSGWLRHRRSRRLIG